MANSVIDNKITLTQFDALTGEVKSSVVIKNCIAAYLFPATRFSVTKIDPYATSEADLSKHEGKRLQFASGKQCYYANQEVADEVFPNDSDCSTYGSLLFTECKNFQEFRQLNILVVNDETGENKAQILPQEAKKLVSDCQGRMSPQVAEVLSEKANRPIQFRLTVKGSAVSEQNFNQVTRIAKGTLSPMNLETLPATVKGYDLVLATSMFKGRKGETELKPGAYQATVGIGVKTEAMRRPYRLGTQFMVNYPQGVKQDVLPLLEQEIKTVVTSLATPFSLCEYLLKNQEKRLSYRDETELSPSNAQDFPEVELTEWENDDNELSEENQISEAENWLYHYLKAMHKAGNYQLLQHKYIGDAVTESIRRRYQELAQGQGVIFESGLAQPIVATEEDPHALINTGVLGKDEICIPHLPEGAEIIVTRYPILHSNGVIILKNKHVPPVMTLKGCVFINPETAADNLQCDFDGDTLAYDLASKYPHLSAEIKKSLAPENRYPSVAKLEKREYEGSRESIALKCALNQVGEIANQIQNAIPEFLTN